MRPDPFAPLVRSPRRRGAAVAVALTAVLAVASLASSAAGLPLFCPFRLLTTVPCPSCGMTRAFVAMGHARWMEAWRMNLAGPLLYGACWGMLFLSLGQAVSGRDLLDCAWAGSKRVVVPSLLALLGAAWVAGLIRRFAG